MRACGQVVGPEPARNPDSSARLYLFGAAMRPHEIEGIAMPTYAAYRRAFAAGALALTITPVFAASRATEIYLDDVRLDAAFLAASSTFADTNARSDALKRYADGEMTHQSHVVALIDDWRARVEGAAPDEVAALPLETGRSVADETIDAGRFSPPPGVGVLLPPAVTLDELSGLRGEAFDATYVSSQIAALTRLEALYDAYARTGDDDGLREMAANELGAVRAKIAAIGRP